jgi:hypothetical protein
LTVLATIRGYLDGKKVERSKILEEIWVYKKGREKVSGNIKMLRKVRYVEMKKGWVFLKVRASDVVEVK